MHSTQASIVCKQRPGQTAISEQRGRGPSRQAPSWQYPFAHSRSARQHWVGLHKPPQHDWPAGQLWVALHAIGPDTQSPPAHCSEGVHSASLLQRLPAFLLVQAVSRQSAATGTTARQARRREEGARRETMTISAYTHAT